tara:strand:- start:8096 stop:8704 length:609 start_codon:yes stop_codon:yes gene_type:complete
MTIKYVVGLAVPGIAAILLSSCGSVPQKEIDAAQAALDSAKMIGAEIYASENFIALQDSLESVLAEIQDEKADFFANYDSVKAQLSYISQQADEVANQTEAKKLELTNQIQTTIAEVKTLINTNRQIILEVPKGKEAADILLTIQQELKTVENAVAETDSLVISGQLIPGLDKATLAKQKATSINSELQSVIDKTKTKTRRS